MDTKLREDMVRILKHATEEAQEVAVDDGREEDAMKPNDASSVVVRKRKDCF